MKVLCKCGGFYLSEGMSCPVCGYELTAKDCAEHLAAQEEYAKSAKKRAWGDYDSRESKAARKAVEAEYRRIKQEQKAEDQRVVSAVLISTANRRSALSTVTRAVIGGEIFGIVGAVGGAASAKSHATHATFSVKYASGRVVTETVPIASARFTELSAFLHN